MPSNTNKILDFLAVGIGPFNLSLACLIAPIDKLEGIFLDKQAHFDWHPGMMLQDTTLQVPFMADLVTLADPTSPFSFLNYIKEKGSIYSFYIRECFFLLRKEYNQYCQWAIEKLPNVHFGIEVSQVQYSDPEACYIVTARNIKSGEVLIYKARKLVLGTGTSPIVPECCQSLKNKAIHSSVYLNHKQALQSKRSITIIGSGQSAAEIFYDLLKEIDTYGYKLNWITRSPRFFPLDYSKLTLEMTSPEYVDYFYNLLPSKRDALLKEQQHLYKGINQSLIADIFDMIYAKRLSHDIEVQLRTNSELVDADYDQEQFNLKLHQVEQDKYYRHKTEALVLSTGYGYKTPGFIRGISDRIAWDHKNRYKVDRNYSIDTKGHEIFVQNAELHTHGFVTPDLGMGCYRNATIIREITGEEYYPLERKIAAQQFEVSDEEEIFIKEKVEA